MQEILWQAPEHPEGGQVRAQGKEGCPNICFPQSGGGICFQVVACLFVLVYTRRLDVTVMGEEETMGGREGQRSMPRF